jgi:hypothetical protein
MAAKLRDSGRTLTGSRPRQIALKIPGHLPPRRRLEPLWQSAEPAGIDNVDDDQRAAIIEVEQAELGGGEVPEDPFAGQPPVVEPC